MTPDYRFVRIRRTGETGEGIRDLYGLLDMI